MNKVTTFLDNMRTYWNTPMKGRYMTFKEIAAYAGGGIGAYFIITLASSLIVGTTNMIVGQAIGVSPSHSYVLYLIATLANIPLTAVRANMIDNTRGKGGKYRPYLMSMGIPTTIISLAYVWFPYEYLNDWFPGQMFGQEKGYVIKCALVLIFNLLLQFYYNFFYDAYTNLIHVLSPNTQERTDVLAIKSVVYSLAPSIVSMVTPLVAQIFADNELYNIKVYRYSYPVFAIVGIGLTIIVFANTQEKIVQARTHTIQVSFIDSFKAVAKNKYFWIIALAGWLGFLESAYGSVIDWSYNYGHVCSGATITILRTIISNASLWGMILAPFCVRKFGKKTTLIGINMMNIVCILLMTVNMENIIWLAACVYMNWFFDAFQQITTPAIQADIRDYHQYRTGERVDGMFATVQTIGNVVTLFTSSIIPMVYEKFGIYEGNGYETSYDILDADIDGGVLLHKVLFTLVIMSAIGAFLNVVPYFFYDLTERKQVSVVRILKVRAMFEDYGNGMITDAVIVEGVDIIREARELAIAETVTPDKKSYKGIKDKAEKKAAKKAYRALKERNENIEVSKLVCEELDKFSLPLYEYEYSVCKVIYEAGIDALLSLNMDEIKAELAAAKLMPTDTKENKEKRTFAIDLANKKKTACRTIAKYYSAPGSFVAPDMAVLEALFNEEDDIDVQMKDINTAISEKKKLKEDVSLLKQQLSNLAAALKENKKKQKIEMDKHAQFGKAAKPFLDSEKVVIQAENYTRLDEIEAVYDEAKARVDAKEAEEEAKREQEKLEQEEYKAKLKAEKAAKKHRK